LIPKKRGGGLRNREERVTAAYIYTLLRLPWLAPDITTAIVNGRQPHQLNAMTLMRRASRLPTDWAEQRRLQGGKKLEDFLIDKSARKRRKKR
jgi:hypothetical protein